MNIFITLIAGIVLGLSVLAAIGEYTNIGEPRGPWTKAEYLVGAFYFLLVGFLAADAFGLFGGGTDNKAILGIASLVGLSSLIGIVLGPLAIGTQCSPRTAFEWVRGAGLYFLIAVLAARVLVAYLPALLR